MSIWADQQIKELRAEVVQLRKEVDELKVPRGPTDLSTGLKGLYERYAQKFGKPPHHLMKPETIAQRLK